MSTEVDGVLLEVTAVRGLAGRGAPAATGGYVAPRPGYAAQLQAGAMGGWPALGAGGGSTHNAAPCGGAPDAAAGYYAPRADGTSAHAQSGA